MRTLPACIAIAALSGGCSLYVSDGNGNGNGNGNDGNEHDGSSGGSGTSDELHHLTVDRHVGAESDLVGLDADGEGNVWLAYSDTINGGFYDNKLVTLVHWNPATRERLATFTYEDEFTPVRGLAYVRGQVWLNYHPAGDGTLMIRVIDPATGAITRTLGSTDGTIEMSPFGADRALLSDLYNNVITVDLATGGYLQTFSTSLFPTTQTGIAWRPGEIWVASWYARQLEVYDESGHLLGHVDLGAIPASVSANDLPILAFDRGQLLVGDGSQLTWFTID